MEYYEALKKLYEPQIGSIWKAPNRIWTSGFASGGPNEDIHPSIVEKLHSSNITLSIVPGTSKEKRGSCVYKVKLNDEDRTTYFLIELSMPYHVDDIKELERGWNGMDELNDDQIEDFKRQIKFCKG